MKNLNEKISKFKILCKKGADIGLTQEENREFKQLEKSISDAMMTDETVFNNYVERFKEAIEPLVKYGFDL